MLQLLDGQLVEKKLWNRFFLLVSFFFLSVSGSGLEGAWTKTQKMDCEMDCGCPNLNLGRSLQSLL